MNRWQALAVLVAMAAMITAFRYPPYSIDGGLIGGTVYVYYRYPPPPDEHPIYDHSLLNQEIAFVALSLLAAVIAFRQKAARRTWSTFLACFGLETAYLALCLPDFDTIVTPEVTWLSLVVLAVITLGIVLAVERRRGGNMRWRWRPTK